MTRVAKRPMTLGVTEAFKQFVLDQLEDLGDVQPRAMFGGCGLYSRGLFFAILARDTVYFKVDDETRGGYERAGSEAFKPYPDRPGTMGYYEVPLSVLESAPELVEWARRAVRVAERAHRRKQ